MKSVASSSSVHGGQMHDDGYAEHEDVAQINQVLPVVVLSSDDEGEVGRQRGLPRVAHRRRRPQTRSVVRFRSPLSSEVFTISSDSGEEEGMGVGGIDIEPIVQSFGDLNIGGKRPTDKQPIAIPSPNLVTVEVQTEISILPHMFLEPSVLNMMINSACDVPANRAVYSPPWVLQKPLEDIPHASTFHASTSNIARMQKMIFGHSYEVACPTSASPCLPLQETTTSVSTELVLEKKIEIVAPTTVDSCLPLQETAITFGQQSSEAAHIKAESSLPLQETTITKLIFGQLRSEVHIDEVVMGSSNAVPSSAYESHYPSAPNTRSRAKFKMHGGNG